jgi:hypothetical protein
LKHHLGIGQTLLIIDSDMDQNSYWVVALQETGVIKHFDCNDLIFNTNDTYGMNLRNNKFVEVENTIK